MWNEIQDKAKFTLSQIIFITRATLADHNQVSDVNSFQPENFFQEKKPSKPILDRWKLILDLFLENGFL